LFKKHIKHKPLSGLKTADRVLCLGNGMLCGIFAAEFVAQWFAAQVSDTTMKHKEPIAGKKNT